MKKLKHIFYLLVICIIMVGCNKVNTKVKADDEVKGPRNAEEVLQKTVEYYKQNPMKSVTLEAKGTIAASENSSNKVEVDIQLHHVFNEDIVEMKNSDLVFKTLYNKKPFEIDLHFFEDGAMAYKFNKSNYYDASDVSTILGIKETIPPCANVEDEVSSTSDASMTEEPTVSPTPSTQVTVSPENSVKEDIRISDVLKLAKRLKLKGNKQFNNREVYILKGAYTNNEIINDINGIIESYLYNLPGEYGNVYYNIYVDRDTFEIIGMDFDISDVVKTVCKASKRVENTITINIKANEMTKVNDVSVKKAELNNFSNVWNVIQYYSKVLAGLSTDANDANK